MRPSDNYQHSNPQARGTSNPKSHYESAILAYLTARIDCTRSQDFNLNIGGVVAWSTSNVELPEVFLEEFNMFI
ncbi:hypothetical protein DFH27DRAFT_617704 [Peziza echinospora]|nr:hypothetical protein DFH27DRAFT_617704 [Peziza echinospora]